MNAVRPVIPSNGIPYHQMRSVGLHSSGREKGGNKERKGYYLFILLASLRSLREPEAYEDAFGSHP